VKGEHVKDAAQDGSVKLYILSIVIFQLRRTGSRGPPRRPSGACMCSHRCATTTAHWTPLPHHHHHRRRRRRRRRRQHVQDAAQDVAEGVAEGVAEDLALGPGRRVPSSRRHHRRRRLCAARAEMGAQLGSSVAFAVLGAQLGSLVAFGSGCGQALPGVPRKAPLCLLKVFYRT